MVLLDPVVEGVMEQHRDVAEDVRQALDGLEGSTWTLAQLAGIGLARVMMSLPLTQQSLDKEYRPMDKADVMTITAGYRHRLTMYEEQRAMPESEQQVAASMDNDGADALAGVPCVVVAHEIPDLFMPFYKGPKGIDTVTSMEMIWQDALKAVVATFPPSAGATLVVAKGCGHSLPTKSPVVAAEMIVGMVERVRRGGR
jgi:hypothetical protein